MKELDIFLALVNGHDYWNHKTHEYVYYNEDYDFDEGTLTMSEAVNIDGYLISDNERDDAVPQMETCHRIATEEGWMRQDDPKSMEYLDQLRVKSYGWGKPIHWFKRTVC
jgi:hypothetical protein